MESQEIFINQAEWQNVLSSLPAKGPLGKLIKSNSAGSAKLSVLLTSKEVSLQAEIHDNYNDIFLTQSGEEEFWAGGEIKDKAEVEPGEWLGEDLSGAQKYLLKSGDILIVPKGVAHKHGFGSAVFIVIKTR